MNRVRATVSPFLPILLLTVAAPDGVVLRPGQQYRSQTVLTFGTRR